MTGVSRIPFTFLSSYSAWTRLAASWVNAHSAVIGAGLASVQPTSLLRCLRVVEVHEGCSLRLAHVVSQHSDTRRLQVELSKNAFHVVLCDVAKAAHEDRVLLVTLGASAASIAATATTVT